jgi:hypothetical protein
LGFIGFVALDNARCDTRNQALISYSAGSAPTGRHHIGILNREYVVGSGRVSCEAATPGR